MASLTEVIRVPYLFPLMLAQVTARLPQGMLSIILLVHVQQVTGSYSSAGLTVGGYSIGAAISGPLMGRWLTRFGTRRVLGTTVALEGVAIGVFGALPNWLALLLAGAFVIGFCTPPALPVTRSLYPSLTPRGMSVQVFSLDSVMQEVVWGIGPLLATTLLHFDNALWTFLVPALIGVIGGVVIIVMPVTGQVPIETAPRRLGRVLLKVPVLLSVVATVLFNATYGAMQAGLVAQYADNQLISGVTLSVFSVGSAIAGLVAARFAMRPWSMATRQLPLLAATLVAPFVETNAIWIILCFLAAGIGSSPALAVMYNVVSSSLRASDASEAFGWMGSAILLGIAIGSAAGGALIDVWGARSSFLLAIAFVVANIALLLVAVRAMPDLSRGAGPLTDTSAIPVIRLRSRPSQPGDAPTL